jgi:predicted ATPase
MNNFEFRWKNFRGIRDTGWLRIRPITIVIGANASGKTSLIAPLLILKQTIESSDTTLPLKTIGKYFNAGSFKDLIFDHDIKNELSFCIRFRQKEIKTNKKIDEIGKYPPGEIELSFLRSDKNRISFLSKYVVRDIYGRIMLSRHKLKSGRYSIRGMGFPKSDRGFYGIIKKTSPERFLFTAEGPFTERLENIISKQIKLKTSKKSSKISLSLSQGEDNYLRTVAFVRTAVDNILKEISYLGPLREYPKRMYEISGEIPHSVGIRGEFAPEILFRYKDKPIMKHVNNWVAKFDLDFHINCNELTNGAFNITLSRKKGSQEFNFADTGFGLSQILPLIVQGYYAKPGALIIAEQPEIHLNPKLQTILADLFSNFAKKKVGVLVETHSEHLLLRLRHLVAKKSIKQEDIALYYTEKDGEKSKIREIPVEQNGHIKLEDWPKGFFQESLRESLGLAAAQRKI